MVFAFLKLRYEHSALLIAILQTKNTDFSTEDDSLGGMVVQWLALLPHSKTVLGSNLMAGWGHSVCNLYVLPVSAWESSRCFGFLP